LAYSSIRCQKCLSSWLCSRNNILSTTSRFWEFLSSRSCLSS
jgi:hypothetical protein